MAPTLDLTGIFQGTIGAGVGVSRGQLRDAMALIRSVHEPLQESASSGQLPHLLPLPRAEAEVLGAGLVGRPVVLLAEPAAGHAAAALAVAAGAAPVLLDALDEASVARAADLPGAALVVLDGPGWVREVATELAPRFSSVLVIAGDGTGGEVWGPAGSVVVSSPGAADLRFGGLGLAALVLLRAAGVDLEPVVSAASAAAEWCVTLTVKDNPAYAIAASFLALEAESGIIGPALLLPERRTELWGQWLSGAWGSVAVRHEVSGELRRVRGDAGRWMLLGDEAGTQRLLGGPSDRVVVSVEGRSGGSVLGRRLTEAHRGQLLQGRRPHIRLRLPRVDVAGLAAGGVVWLQASLVVGASRGQDPLTMDAADELRAAVDEDTLRAGHIADEGGPTE
jgi:hypothetical protein